MDASVNVLVSSAGRRGALVRLIRQAVEPQGGQVFAVDAGPWSSACRLAADWEQVPRCSDAGFLESVLAVCRRHDVSLIVPTIDPELAVYAAHREAFREAGVAVAVSGPETVAISGDKLATHEFLTAAGLPTVDRIDFEGGMTPGPHDFPLIIKPRFGSGSQGVQIVEDEDALRFFWRRTQQPIVQRLATGREYTVNCYVDRKRRCLAAVPHLRVETRGGEVSKCVTIRHPTLIELAERLIAALPDPWGPMCFQAFVDDAGRAQIIELNPRFGGGYPICHHSGADFIRLLIGETRGNDQFEPIADWREGVAMTRWDEAVFTTAEDVGLCA